MMNVRLSTLGYISLTLAMIFSTSTYFKIGPLGLAEVLFAGSIAFFSLDLINSKNLDVDEISKGFLIFWIVSFCILGIGSFCSFLLIDRSNFSLHTLTAFFLVFLCIGSLLLTDQYHRHLEMILKILFFVLIGVYLALYVFDKINIVVPKGMIYAKEKGRLILWSDNPNKIALSVVSLPFLAVYWSTKSNSLAMKLVYICFGLMAGFFGFLTRAEALLVAWFLSTATFFFIPIPRVKRETSVFLKGVFLLTIYLCFFDFLNEKITRMYNTGQQGAERFNLLWNGIEAMRYSPLFGFGPGEYSGVAEPFLQREAHNVLVDWLTHAGLLGCVALILFMIWTLIKVSSNKILTAAVLALYAFSFFHFPMRQPIWWLFVVGIVSMGSHNHLILKNKKT